MKYWMILMSIVTSPAFGVDEIRLSQLEEGDAEIVFLETISVGPQNPQLRTSRSVLSMAPYCRWVFQEHLVYSKQVRKRGFEFHDGQRVPLKLDSEGLFNRSSFGGMVESVVISLRVGRDVLMMECRGPDQIPNGIPFSIESTLSDINAALQGVALIQVSSGDRVY